MTRLLFFLNLILIISCNSAPDNNQTAIINTDSSTPTVAIANSSTDVKADSIDKSNANTIDADKDNINKATVSLKDSMLVVTSDKYRDHRFFGYSKPDVHSKRMILFSIFTNDVKGNPFGCPYGSYYQTRDMQNMELKYLSADEAYVKFAIMQNNTQQNTVYIDKKWIDIEK